MLSSPVTRAKLGITALLIIVIATVWIIRLTPLGGAALDLTEGKVHTVSDGTRKILSDLKTPVVLRYYASRNSEGIPREFELYMSRVDALLERFKSIAGNQLIVQEIDPEPDTDEEDSASIDGIPGQRISEFDNFYFGISVSSLEKQTALPFLRPSEETLLEYQLINAIAEVTRTEQTVIGIMSGLKLKGGITSPSFPGQQVTQNRPWIIYQQLEQTYEIQDLELNSTEISSEITTLLLVHPTDVTEETERAIGRFVTEGGNLVVLVDPYAIAAQDDTPSNPQIGVFPSLASDLPYLFKEWGVIYDPTKAIADNKYRQTIQGRTAPAVLTLNESAFVQKDEIVTQDLNDLTLLVAGGLQKRSNAGLEFTPLVKSSSQTYPVDPQKAAELDQSIVGLPVNPESYAFAVRLEGNFSKENAGTPTKEAGSVYIFSDVDWISDRFAFQEVGLGGGQRVVQPTNGNSALFLNVIDQMTGSSALVGARSRASTARPFTRIKEMQTKAEEKVGAEIREFREKQDLANERLQELQAQKTGADKLFLSPEQEEEIQTIKRESVTYSKRIRELQKELKAETDALEGLLFKLNVVLPAAIVAIFAFIYLKHRSRVTSAS